MPGLMGVVVSSCRRPRIAAEYRGGVCANAAAVMPRFFRGAGVLLGDRAGTEGTDRVLGLIMTVSAPRKHYFCEDFTGYRSKNRHKLPALLADVGCDLAFCQGKSCPLGYSLFVKLVCLYQGTHRTRFSAFYFYLSYILTYYLNVYIYNELKSASWVF